MIARNTLSGDCALEWGTGLSTAAQRRLDRDGAPRSVLFSGTGTGYPASGGPQIGLSGDVSGWRAFAHHLRSVADHVDDLFWPLGPLGMAGCFSVFVLRSGCHSAPSARRSYAVAMFSIPSFTAASLNFSAIARGSCGALKKRFLSTNGGGFAPPIAQGAFPLGAGGLFDQRSYEAQQRLMFGPVAAVYEEIPTSTRDVCPPDDILGSCSTKTRPD
jgi:hypothetical protein